MSDRAAFVAAIEADPDNDLPRLAWADWLDDHGEHPRAELIRVQCAAKRSRAIERREEELLDALGREWPAELLPAGHMFAPRQPEPERDNLRYMFDRGCLLNLGFDAAEYERIGGIFDGREPLLRVYLSDAGPAPRQLTAVPHLRRVVTVHGPGYGPVLASPHLTGLREVIRCEPADVGHLAAGPAAGWVHFVWVDGGGAAADWSPADLARMLAETPAFANLVALELSNVGFAAAEYRTLMASPHLPPMLGLMFQGRGQPRPSSAVARNLLARFPGMAAMRPC